VNQAFFRASQDSGFFTQYQYERSFKRDHTKWFIPGVQYQRAHNPPNKKRATKNGDALACASGLKLYPMVLMCHDYSLQANFISA
jgi:hypothetical protein